MVFYMFWSGWYLASGIHVHFETRAIAQSKGTVGVKMGTDDDEGKVHRMMVTIVAEEDNNEKPVEENGKMSAESRDPSVGDNLARSYQDLCS